MIAPLGRAVRTFLLGLLSTLLVVTGLLFTSPSVAAVTYDGSSELQAAASCWEIKQNNFSATDGVYWLQTPQLRAAKRFYCDMTTDGGGWVLIGRGRDGWVYDYNGKGSIAEVSNVVTGPAAFSPRQLDSRVVDALLGGRRIDSMSDGIRLRRADNTNGTSWQETRFTFKSRDRWNWAFGAGQPIQSFTMDGTSGSNTSTRDFGTNSGYRRVTTYETSSNSYVRGFNYGSTGYGTSDSSSYIYSAINTGRYGSPFTQVFIRPKLRTSDLTYAAIPDAGTAEITGPSVAKSGSLESAWGVTGTGAGGTGELATEAQAFAQIGNTMYVGGNFTTVQKGAGATGSDRVDQSYLAAFNATTGDWISSFRPTINHQVKALTALPDGTLAVGGDFSTVNGQAHSGLVILNASTGAVVPGFSTQIENRVGGGGVVSVRGLDTDGTYLYLGGAFSHIVKGNYESFDRNAGRMELSTGIGDAQWNPNFNGAVASIDLSDDGTRLYAAGYFTNSNGTLADRGAAVRTIAGAPLATPAWQPIFSTSGSARYQQAIKQVGNRVWLGGSQHSMFAYSTSTFALQNAHITKAGGDLQAIGAGNGYVYGGCHCGDWTYSDTTQYDGLSPGQSTVNWSQGDRINFTGAWSAATGDLMPDFTPTSKARNGMGTWAILVAADGTLWTGGSFTSSVKENGANQWVGGFIRYGLRDAIAPNKPSGVSVTRSGSNATIAWTAPVGGADSYEVLRGNRVVGTSSTTSLTVGGAADGDRYFVRALDPSKNRSASTAVATAVSTPDMVDFVTPASTWSYWVNNGQAVNSAWQSPSYGAAGWGSGTAPLGWGNNVTTNVDVATGQTRPLSSYFRRTFNVANPNGFSELTLTTRADDGVAVYINGTEVARKNLPAGELTSGTYATAAPSTPVAVADPLTVTVPSSVLVAGTNAVSVEVHSNYRSTPSMSMDVALTGKVGTPPPPDPDPDPGAAELIAQDATWSYRVNTTEVDPAWASTGFNAGAWSTGAAVLGWGNHHSIVTDVDVAAGQTRPLASYFRKSITVSNPSAFTTLTLTTRADDGIVVYVNGVEVGRKNLPSGTITSGTYATSAPSTNAAEDDPFVITIPASMLTAGTNVVSAEVHSNYRSTKSMSFALQLEAE